MIDNVHFIPFFQRWSNSQHHTAISPLKSKRCLQYKCSAFRSMKWSKYPLNLIGFTKRHVALVSKFHEALLKILNAYFYLNVNELLRFLSGNINAIFEETANVSI